MPPTPTHTPPQARSRAGLVSRSARFLLDLIFPPRCLVCGRVDTPWCPQCQSTLATLPINPVTRRTAPPLRGIIATAPHTGLLRTYVHGLKYENARYLAAPLGNRLARCIHAYKMTYDTIAAVPLHVQRQHERGYNQSKLLTQVAATYLNKPDSSAAIVREQHTRPQVGLSRSQRQSNVSGAFRAANSFQGQRVLLVDDVYTTGATLQACAQALANRGAAAVYAVTLTAAAGGHNKLI